ncbi:MAG: prepilin-type N-terminal cleavage/methylation domain-containing protein [Myxococcota bacterium]
MTHHHANLRTRASSGFTLIEIMIALSILALGLLSVAAMQLHAMRGGSSGRQLTQAATLAEDRMEELQRDRWDAGALDPTSGWVNDSTDTTTVQSTSGNATQQTYTVQRRVANLVVGWTRTVDVRVSWDEPNRPGRSVTLSTIRYNRNGT